MNCSNPFNALSNQKYSFSHPIETTKMPHTTDTSLAHLFENNRAWAQNTRASEPTFFSDLAKQQNPEYMWIGCADSRVPANELIGLLPGEVFVHRNVANILAHSDLNCLSAMQYAIDVLKVKHIIICGHYGCGGVIAVFENRRVGLVDNWLRHIHDIKHKYTAILDTQTNDSESINRLCELNVIEQVVNACRSTIVQDAWARGQGLSVHAWCYSIHDGLVRQLDMDVSGPEELQPAYAKAIASIPLTGKRDE